MTCNCKTIDSIDNILPMKIKHMRFQTAKMLQQLPMEECKISQIYYKTESSTTIYIMSITNYII